MGVNWRLRILAGTMVLIVAGIGCNPLTVPFFMMFGVEDKTEAEFQLGSKEKETRVLILAYSSPDVQTDQVAVDRQIGTLVAGQLQERAKANQEKLKVIPFHKVEKFKNDHPNWKAMGATDIGRQFDADYVIDLEVVALNLYEPGSHKSLFTGRSKVDLAVLDMRKTYDGPVFKKSFSTEYPKAKGPIPVADDNNVEKFRDAFINRIATDICWTFTQHKTLEEHMCD